MLFFVHVIVTNQVSSGAGIVHSGGESLRSVTLTEFLEDLRDGGGDGESATAFTFDLEFLARNPGESIRVQSPLRPIEPNTNINIVFIFSVYFVSHVRGNESPIPGGRTPCLFMKFRHYIKKISNR